MQTHSAPLVVEVPKREDLGPGAWARDVDSDTCTQLCRLLLGLPLLCDTRLVLNCFLPGRPLPPPATFPKLALLVDYLLVSTGANQPTNQPTDQSANQPTCHIQVRSCAN